MRASAALFSHLSTFCKGGICEGRCEAPRGPPMRSAGVRWCVVVLPMLGARHTKAAAKGGTRQSCPPPPIPNLGRWDSRGGARRARGPGALGGRAGVRGATLASLCARLGASKGSGTARLRRRRLRRWVRHTVRTAHPPRGRARGRAARSWPHRRWLSIREEVGTSCSSPIESARAAGRRGSTSHRSPAHCLPTASRWSRAAATNQIRGLNCNL